MVFMGYFRTPKDYICYDPSTSRTIISCDITFLEDQPYFVPSTPSPTTPEMSLPMFLDTDVDMGPSSSFDHVRVGRSIHRYYSRRAKSINVSTTRSQDIIDNLSADHLV